MSRALFLKGQTNLEGLVASPRSTSNKRSIYKRYTDKRSAKKAEMKEESRLAASRKHNSPRLPTPRRARTPDFADVLAKKLVEAYRDGTEREVNSAFSSPSAQKAPSAVLQPSSSGWRKGVPTVHNDSESSLVTTGGGTKSAGLSPHGLMGTPNQRTVSGPGGKGFLGVAQPGPHDRNTSTTTQSAPSTQRLPASADASPTTESQEKQRPDTSTFNESTPDSLGKEFSSPVHPTRPSSKDNQRPGQNSPAATSGLSAFTNSSPSGRTPLPSSSPRRPLPSSAPGASRAPKRQRRDSTLGGNGSSA